MRALLVAIVLAFPAPALAQDAPSHLYEPARVEVAGDAATTDGGRSEVLLVLALVAAMGAGALATVAWRRRPAAVVAAPAAPAPEAWHPRVKPDLPPLPAFGSGPEPPGPGR